MKVLPAIGAAAILIASAGAAWSQQTQTASSNREVVEQRVCEDGSASTLAVSGSIVTVEAFSKPKPNGLVAGYEEAYDLADMDEAREHYNALRCPE